MRRNTNNGKTIQPPNSKKRNNGDEMKNGKRRSNRNNIINGVNVPNRNTICIKQHNNKYYRSITIWNNNFWNFNNSRNKRKKERGEKRWT